MAFQNVNQPTLSSRMYLLPSDSRSSLNASEIMLEHYYFKGSEPRWFRRKSSRRREISMYKYFKYNYDFMQNWRAKTYAKFIRTCNVVRYTYYVLRYTVPVVRSTPYVDCYTLHFIRYTLYVMQYTSQPFVFNTHTHTHAHTHTIMSSIINNFYKCICFVFIQYYFI